MKLEDLTIKKERKKTDCFGEPVNYLDEEQDDILDKTLDIFSICLGVSLIIGLPIFFYNTSKNIEEEKCVKFYKENNYILESCEIYKKRLELLNK